MTRYIVVAAVSLAAALAGAPSASAVTPAPGWTIESFATPANFSSANNVECIETKANQTPACDSYTVSARNAGSVSTDGSEIVLSDTVPAGLTVQEVKLEARPQSGNSNRAPEYCTTTPSLTTTAVVCDHIPLTLAPDEELTLMIFVTVNETAVGALQNEAKVEGGGAPAAETQAADSANQIGSPVSFGFSHFRFYTSAPDGTLDAEAGGHPYELTLTVGLRTNFRLGPSHHLLPEAVEDPRDFVTDLPLGFVGSVLAAPQCTFSELTAHTYGGEGGCPRDTIIGHLRSEPESLSAIDGPIYNMTPEKGFPAEFAYVDVTGAPHAFYTRVVPTPKGYVLQATNPEIPAVALRSVVATFYGVPAEKDHTANLAVPFFTNPTDCSGAEQTTTIYMDSWENPAKLNPDGTPVDLEEEVAGRRVWAKAESSSPPVTGCNALQFPAEVTAQPTTHESDEPSGLDMEIKLPQTETTGVPATPSLKDAVVTLPEGLTVDPSAGDGLAACSEAQIGWEEAAPGPLRFNPAPPQCPKASKIGELTLESPLVGHELKGEMFLAAQNENPFHTTLAAYVVVNDPVTGVLIKIAGKFLPDPHTGRMTAVFDENPNLPFSDLKLHFFGGPRAELATPESCGTFTTGTELTPWSAPDSGLAATPFDNFLIDEACPDGFKPSFTAGSQDLQAGAYTTFVASFARSDTDQELAGLTLTLPPGLLGKIAGVPLCSQAQVHEAEAGKAGCPEGSQVGTVQAGAGPGPDPLFVGGKAYLTGPYNGGPYGLAVVVPAVAGPYNFGTVVVRQSLRIDERTAQVTDVSDPFPKIIDGIPLRLRRVDVTLDRPQFAFNPTSCEHEQFTGAISGSPLGASTTLNGAVGYATLAGSTSPFVTPFAVTNCATLGFTPKISVATKAHASKANGASLSFKVSYPAGAMGKQSWFNEAKFDLPKQLPSRLETLQKACLSGVFEANRAACPAASVIGHAIVHTQVLPVPLEGPIYFVSYGGAKFPEAVMVLQGDNVHVELHGETFIDKKTGITSATFRNTPDVPFESIEVNIPSGRFSEFGANLPAKDRYDFCGQTLNMPTLFKAQNGLEIDQTTRIAVSGCPVKKAKHAKKVRNTKRRHH